MVVADEIQNLLDDFLHRRNNDFLHAGPKDVALGVLADCYWWPKIALDQQVDQVLVVDLDKGDTECGLESRYFVSGVVLYWWPLCLTEKLVHSSWDDSYDG